VDRCVDAPLLVVAYCALGTDKSACQMSVAASAAAAMLPGCGSRMNMHAMAASWKKEPGELCILFSEFSLPHCHKFQ
jgi:hypothetical protein